MMIGNDRRMPSSADLHGKTESTARGEQPCSGGWEGIPIGNGPRKNE